MATRQGSLEALDVTFAAYKGRRVLLTGHTGFKGSWLALWLKELGAQVTGVALAPETSPSHWDLLHLDMTTETLDIRDAAALRALVQAARPEIVFHLAAQSLVRRSYQDPLGTWNTNVLGTANLLEACRAQAGIKGIVVVTTDKCYENREWEWGYRENDRLGGHDAYSASKAATELVVASYRSAFFSDADAPLLATARAGNVIGGGDWSADRLVPDLFRAITAGKVLEIRSPAATRPWQHVLEPLSGYLTLGQRLLEGDRTVAQAWNFGPDHDGNLTVEAVLSSMRRHWPRLDWTVTTQPQPHEAGLLHLDSSKARQQLGWRPVWSAEETIARTAEWYRKYLEQKDVISREQLVGFAKQLAARG